MRLKTTRGLETTIKYVYKKINQIVDILEKQGAKATDALVKDLFSLIKSIMLDYGILCLSVTSRYSFVIMVFF